jgi:hypothetical protein
MTPLIALLLAPGCFISEAQYEARLHGGDSAAADADTDTDADTDADTDTDTDTDSDTDTPTGTFRGSFDMTLDGTATSDSCTGAITADLDADSLYGSFTCVFDNNLVYQNQTGTVEGTTSGGNLTFTSDLDTVVPWSGSLGSGPTLYGDFSAEGVPYDIDHVDVSGHFRATPE